ncbi:MAG TPA: TadE family protein [Vicinamibacterales bacterium]|nr:TadE family protein [Vicinamibacterales bacterium]
MRTKLKNERGAALLETAITIPIILLICVGIFEFGRAYQTWQVLTNAAREGARVAVISGSTPDQIRAAVSTYMTIGELPAPADSQIVINQSVALPFGTGTQVTVNYPFNFMVLNGVARMVRAGSSTGGPLTMTAQAVMRNE